MRWRGPETLKFTSCWPGRQEPRIFISSRLDFCNFLVLCILLPRLPVLSSLLSFSESEPCHMSTAASPARPGGRRSSVTVTATHTVITNVAPSDGESMFSQPAVQLISTGHCWLLAGPGCCTAPTQLSRPQLEPRGQRNPRPLPLPLPHSRDPPAQGSHWYGSVGCRCCAVQVCLGNQPCATRPGSRVAPRPVSNVCRWPRRARQ